MEIYRLIFILFDNIIVTVSRGFCLPITIAVFAHVESHLLSDFEKVGHDLCGMIFFELVIVDGQMLLAEISRTVVLGDQTQALLHHVGHSSKFVAKIFSDQESIFRNVCVSVLRFFWGLLDFVFRSCTNV